MSADPRDRVARDRIERFARRFGEPHRRLARYAALPLVLTPELLGYLRTQFLRGRDGCDWIAEADLLLSDLCTPVGYEQYAMDQSVRARLIAELTEREGPEPLREAARLLLRYVRHLGTDGAHLSPAELEAEQWSAMAYLEEERGKVAPEIAAAFAARLSLAPVGSAVAAVSAGDLARLVQIAQGLAPNLADHRALLDYASEVARLLREPAALQVLAERLSGVGEMVPLRRVAGVLVPDLSGGRKRMKRLGGLGEPFRNAFEDGTDDSPARQPSAQFNWLHLSDFHQGAPERDRLWPSMRDELLRDLERLHARCGPWDLILFTGDMSCHGSRQEFARFNREVEYFRLKLKRMAGGREPLFFAVPGNHDLVRPSPKDPAVKLLNRWWVDPGIMDEFWADPASIYRRIIDSAFADYSAWWRSYAARLPVYRQGLLPGDFSATIAKNGVRLGILGLNTAFLQLSAGDYKGRLALHTRQFDAACGVSCSEWVDRHHACLLMTHHSPSWLHPEAQMHLNRLIAPPGRFALHLFGHAQETALLQFGEVDAGHRRSFQGLSLFGLKHSGAGIDRSHGYAAGHLRIEAGIAGQLVFWPRRVLVHGRELCVAPDMHMRLTGEHTSPQVFDLHRPYPKGGATLSPAEARLDIAPQASIVVPAAAGARSASKSLDLTCFVSYAHTDKIQAHRLLDLLRPRLAIARDYRFAHWIDDRIGVGERWIDEIGAALSACDFGLMLVSPAFLASGFIRREELPHFIERVRDPAAGPDAPAQTRIRKPLVPVMLKSIPLDGSGDLAGLDQLQIFRDREGRGFSETRGHLSDAFADQLAAAMLATLRRVIPNGIARNQ